MAGYLLLETKAEWLIGALGAPLTDFEFVAERSVLGTDLAKEVERFGAKRDDARNLIVALHATSVVSAMFTRDSSTKSGDRKAMLYQMEPSLPFDAEEATADFAGDDPDLVGVSVRTDKLQRFVEDVEARGTQVLSIFPAALGAAQAYADNSRCLVWRCNDAVEVIACSGSVLRHWSHLPVLATTVARTIQMENLGTPLLINEPGLDAQASDTDDFGTQIAAATTATSSMFEHVSTFAADIADGTVSPWIELRRGALANGDPNRPYRKSLNRLLIAAAALLILFSLACWYRAQSYETQAVEYADKQRELFKEVFPGVRTNAPISRLRSEHARFTSSRQTNSDVELPVSAIEPTVSMLAAIPQDLRIKFTELRMENGKLDIAAEMKSYADVSRLARSLEAGGFDIDAPTQQQLDDGRVSTTVRGRLKNSETAQASATPAKKGGSQ